MAPQRTLMAALAASLSLVALGLGGASVLNSLGSSEPPSVAMAFQPPPRAQECLDIPLAHDPALKPEGWFCKLNPGSAQEPSFFVFGDSHGLQLVSSFDKAAASAHRTGQFAGFSGCLPLLGLYPLTRPNQARYDCHALNARVLAHVKSQGIKELFLVAKWSYYTDFWNGTPYLNAVGLAPTDDISQAQSRKAFQAGLLDTVAAYQQLGVRLHVIEQVPQQLRAPDAAYQQAWAVPRRVDERLAALAVPLEQHLALQHFVKTAFRNLPHGAPRSPSQSRRPIDLINLDGLFCDDTACHLGTPETPYYQDASHLSLFGADLILPTLTARLNNPHN